MGWVRKPFECMPTLPTLLEWSEPPFIRRWLYKSITSSSFAVPEFPLQNSCQTNYKLFCYVRNTSISVLTVHTHTSTPTHPPHTPAHPHNSNVKLSGAIVSQFTHVLQSAGRLDPSHTSQLYSHIYSTLILLIRTLRSNKGQKSRCSSFTLGLSDNHDRHIL